jgi:hypothetical protein
MIAEENKKIHYENIHPIVEISNFISEETAAQVTKFLDLNHDGDECWGAICFREYWVKLHPSIADKEPKLSQESDRSLLKDINLKIYENAKEFLGEAGESLVFSKFKGHRHITESYTPKHGFGPGVVACILVLNDDYSGGEFFMDSPSIEMRLNARSLYMFKEGGRVEHGVKKVLSGIRLSLVSHWQDASSPYKWAGAPN